jgi:hypothetical protein
VDAIAGMLLYTAIVNGARSWMTDATTRLAGAIAVAIYNLIPVALAVLTTGNLTNAFAQSVAVVALVLIAIDDTRIERWGWTLALTAALAVAYLSHTGTLAILFVATVLIALLFFVRGGPPLRSAAAAVAAATLAAATLAVVVYYAHFLDTYRTELARIGHETATAASDAGGRTIGDRIGLVPYSIDIYIGAPALLVALIGALHLVRRHGRERLTLAFEGWVLSCLVFLVIGILTPVDMRYYLASVPAVAIAAGLGAAWAWRRDSGSHQVLWRVTAGVFLAAAIATGVHSWWSALG